MQNVANPHAPKASVRDCIGPLAGFVALGAWVGTWSAIVPAVKHEASISDGELGIALLLGAVVTPIGMCLAGPLLERHGSRTIGASCLAFAASTLLLTGADSFAMLALALAVTGVTGAMLDIIMNVAISVLEGYGRHIMQLAHALFSAGMLVSSLAAGWARHVDTPTNTIIVALAGCLAFLAAANLRRTSVELAHAPTRADSARTSRVRWRGSPFLWALGLIGCISFMFEGGVEAWSALHLEDTFAVAPGASALAPAAFALAMMIGRLAGHWLASHVDDYTLLMAGGALALLGISGSALAPSPWIAVGGFLVAAAGLSTVVPTAYGLAGRGAEPGRRGSDMSLVTTVSWFGAVIGPAYIGGLAGAFDLRVALLGLALLGAPMVVLTLAARRSARASRVS